MRPRRGCWQGSWVAALAFACVGAGACGGGGGDKPISFTPVSATSDGALYTLTLGDLKMVIDASTGARITEFSLVGTNVLVTRDENLTFGSTYWPSPQASWCAAGGDCWPPVAAIDSEPYTGSIDAANSIQLTGGTASIAAVADSALTVSKQFTPVPGSGAIDVTYTLTNTSPTVGVSLAPWQVSRVAAGGLTFLGQGTGAPTYATNSDPAFMLTGGAGDLWYAQAPVQHDSKAFADGAGWLAQVTPDRLLYLASFPDIQPADAAPGEAEIEVFTNSAYVELEAQGALTAIGPGEALTWTVRWKLRRLPGGTTVAAGDAKLASFARAALAE
jgi:hypothetical protein